MRVHFKGTDMAKYKVRVGKDFEIYAADVEDAQVLEQTADLIDKAEKANTRRVLTYVSVTSVIAAISIATYLGLKDGTFNELNVVWTASSWVLAFILGAYFGGSKNK